MLGPELQGGAKARTGVGGVRAGETMARVGDALAWPGLTKWDCDRG